SSTVPAPPLPAPLSLHDALPILAAKAKAAGVVYSLAWGDQPALICEHVDWARTCGFRVVAAGKGTRYEPHYHRSTPDTVWDILRSEEHTSELQSRENLVCRLLLE